MRLANLKPILVRALTEFCHEANLIISPLPASRPKMLYAVAEAISACELLGSSQLKKTVKELVSLTRFQEMDPTEIEELVMAANRLRAQLADMSLEDLAGYVDESPKCEEFETPL